MSYRQPFDLSLESNAGRLEVLLQEHLRLKHRVGENGAQEGFIWMGKKMPKKMPNESNECFLYSMSVAQVKFRFSVQVMIVTCC